MSSSALPPPAPPTGATGRSRRRWPWLVAALSLALVLVTSRAGRGRPGPGGGATGARLAARAGRGPAGTGTAIVGPGRGRRAARRRARARATDRPRATARRVMRRRAATRRARRPATRARRVGSRTCSTSCSDRPGCPTSTPPASRMSWRRGRRSSRSRGPSTSRWRPSPPSSRTSVGCASKMPSTPDFLPSDEFERELGETVESEYPAEQADLDGRVLELLGAVPQGHRSEGAPERGARAGQVAGYYDPETGEIVVRVPDAGGEPRRQRPGDAGPRARSRPHRSGPRSAGHRARRVRATPTWPGDRAGGGRRHPAHAAVLARARSACWTSSASALSPDALAAQDQLEDVPAYLRNELMFPYLVRPQLRLPPLRRGRLARGRRGLRRSAADDRRDPVPGGRRRQARGPRAILPRPAAGWTTGPSDTLGAAPLLWLLQAPGGDEEAGHRGRRGRGAPVGGWRAHAVHVRRPVRAGRGLVDDDDGGALCAAVRAVVPAAFDATSDENGGVTVMAGGDQVGRAACEGRDVRLGHRSRRGDGGGPHRVAVDGTVRPHPRTVGAQWSSSRCPSWARPSRRGRSSAGTRRSATRSRSTTCCSRCRPRRWTPRCPRPWRASCGRCTSPRVRPSRSATPLAVITATADEPMDEARGSGRAAPAAPDRDPTVAARIARRPRAAAQRAQARARRVPVAGRARRSWTSTASHPTTSSAAGGTVASPATTSWPRPPTDRPSCRRRPPPRPRRHRTPRSHGPGRTTTSSSSRRLGGPRPSTWCARWPPARTRSSPPRSTTTRSIRSAAAPG